MKNIVYTRPDGGVSVLKPSLNAQRPNESEADFMARIRDKDVPSNATNIAVVDKAELPYRGGLRNAWRQTAATAPFVNMVEARELKMKEMRLERDRRLAGLDGPELREQAKGAQVKLEEIRARKQALRDLPETVGSDPAFSDETEPARLDAYEPEWP